MTKSVIRCLCDKPAIDFKCMARFFVKEYFTEPNRGYGANVTEIFKKLKNNKFDDIYKPAREQFGGSGSYGNGAAMRIAPVALYFYNDEEAMLHAATKCAEITHTNQLGVHGALLQAIAVRESFLLQAGDKIDVEQFCTNLIQKMEKLEADEDDE